MSELMELVTVMDSGLAMTVVLFALYKMSKSMEGQRLHTNQLTEILLKAIVDMCKERHGKENN